MKKTVLITGATSGIGEATAEILSTGDYRLILTGRRSDRLLTLKNKLSKNTDVIALCFDIRNYEKSLHAFNSLPEEWKKIDILVNNAGLAAGYSAIQNGNLEDWEQMIDTNIKGLLYITRIVLPGMVERNSGHIINISSIAGKETYPMGNVYCASKSAVQSLSKAMRIDLLQHGIKVSSICPGAVHTEFALVRFKGDSERAGKVYEGIHPLFARDIAEVVHFILTRPAHVNIDDILVMPTDQAFSRDFNRK